MSWSKTGALALLKIKETVLNGEWDKWWETGRERNIKVGKYKPPLPASYFKKEEKSSPLIEVTIPAFIGPDQGKPWLGVLRKLSEAGITINNQKSIRKLIPMYYHNLNNITTIMLIGKNNKP